MQLRVNHELVRPPTLTPVMHRASVHASSADGSISQVLVSNVEETHHPVMHNNNNNNTVISIALFTDRPGALTTSDVCSTK